MNLWAAIGSRLPTTRERERQVDDAGHGIVAGIGGELQRPAERLQGGSATTRSRKHGKA